ncbi:3-dehydroquinate synthase [Candidatus Bathyarchaeota archaeon]|nr:3-dehydroquinate synthase [Candidatus Bathyarchaeota archaeon]
MKAIEVSLGARSYPIIVGTGLVERLCDHLPKNGKLAVITTPIINDLYGNLLESIGRTHDLIMVPDGEEAKTWETVEIVLGKLLEYGLDRKSTVVALGGGTVGDLAGFVASIYMRGIDVVQIPTTLLAMVDSSIGGKTAVNHPMGKNLVGSFHQPSKVVIDPLFLNSLPEREIRSGLAETVKYGIISDEEIVKIFENTPVEEIGQEVMVEIIAKCTAIKARYVEQDERDNKGIRASLNYGHTTGHSVENLSKHEINHGEGVAIGMMVAALIAENMGLVDREMRARQERLLKKIGLPTKVPVLAIDEMMEVMHMDKKAEDVRIRFVIPTGIGSEPLLEYLSEDIIVSALRELR